MSRLRVVVERAPRCMYLLDVWTDSGEIPLLEDDEKLGRLVLVLADETGCAATAIDLNELLGWLRKHKPELLVAP